MTNPVRDRQLDASSASSGFQRPAKSASAARSRVKGSPGGIFLDDHAFVQHVLEVSTYPFQSSSMRLPWCLLKACTLADSKGNTRSHVASQVVHHTKDGSIVEGLVVEEGFVFMFPENDL
jgi:hypothetical protein